MDLESGSTDRYIQVIQTNNFPIMVGNNFLNYSCTHTHPGGGTIPHNVTVYGLHYFDCLHEQIHGKT